jgi:hypothetical protein
MNAEVWRPAFAGGRLMRFLESATLGYTHRRPNALVPKLVKRGNRGPN